MDLCTLYVAPMELCLPEAMQVQGLMQENEELKATVHDKALENQVLQRRESALLLVIEQIKAAAYAKSLENEPLAMELLERESELLLEIEQLKAAAYDKSLENESLERELLQEIADLNAKMDDLKENHVDEVRLLRKEVKLWQGLIRGWMSNHFKYQQHLEQADE